MPALRGVQSLISGCLLVTSGALRNASSMPCLSGMVRPAPISLTVKAAATAARRIAPLPVLLLCHFDPVSGRYTLAITKVLRVMAALAVLALGGTLAVLHRPGYQR